MRRFLVRALLPSPAVGAAIAVFAATLSGPNNPDTLWHLAIGRWILDHHAVPDISRFYYSATTGFGYDYSWLSQAVLFGAYRLLGGAGIAILNSVVAGFIFYFLHKLLERNSTNLLANFAVLGLAFATITAYLSGRPVMFTVGFLTLEVFILSGFVHRSSSIVHRSSLIWLIPPITALWANLHPGFVVAPLLILAFLPLARTTRDRRTLAMCLAATVVAIILNPYGWRMYLMPLETARSMSMLRGLSEWTSVSGWETVIWGGLVALVTCGLSLRRQPLPVMLMVALAALAAGVSNRNMPLFGVIVVFALGRTLLPALLRKEVEVEAKVKRGVASSASASASASAFASAFLRKFDVKFEAAGGWFWAIAIPLLLIGAVRLQLPLEASGEVTSDQVRTSPFPLSAFCLTKDLEFNFSGYPAAAVRYIEDHDCPDNLFVRETWSSYLLWAMPNRKLFFDAKGGFSREAAEAHSELVKPKAGWRDVADRYGLSTFLLERGSPLAVVLSEAADWRREYSDSLAEVFVRVP